MNDSISRQAAIDMFQNLAHDDWNQGVSTTWANAFAESADMINDLPPAQPEQRWIPVTERLPEKDGRYQVTRHDYVTNTEFIDILWYEKNIWWNGHQMGDYAVTAWMPLPDPWKGEEE